MNDKQTDLRVLILDNSPVESAVLLTLLSPLSADLTASSQHSEGAELLLEAQRKQRPYDLVFLALPGNGQEELETAVKALALAMQVCGPRRTVVLGGGKLPPQVQGGAPADAEILQKPITRAKLAQVLEPLGIDLPKLNCWQYMRCGRQAGGAHVQDQGLCPASREQAVDGLHGGTCGGRVCWAISGTLCGGTVQGSFAGKIENCMECDFYRLVRSEEGRVFESIDSIMGFLKRKRFSA